MTIGHDKQFTLYSHPQGSNPLKVKLILEELGLSYHTIEMSDWADLKKPEFANICPTGYVPVLIDHFKNDFKIWDSGAIILYLVETYDSDKKISFNTPEENALAKQYLMFQMSSQGSTFREAMWYKVYYPEDVPTVISRHLADIRKILTVLSTVLESSENGFLVGGKLSYSDLSFLPWNWALEFMPETAGWREEFPIVAKWQGKLENLESVKKLKQARTEAFAS